MPATCLDYPPPRGIIGPARQSRPILPRCYSPPPGRVETEIAHMNAVNPISVLFGSLRRFVEFIGGGGAPPPAPPPPPPPAPVAPRGGGARWARPWARRGARARP